MKAPLEYYEAAGIGAWAIHVDGQPVAVVYGDPDTVPALAATRTGQDFLQPERPGRPIIQHGNTDIALSMCELGEPQAERELFPERDELRDPELRLLAHAHEALLRSLPVPETPEWDYDALPADWDEARERAVDAGGPF